MENIFFRVDSSIEIGSGHVMRCLALADALRGRGAEISFICRELPGHISHIAKERGFRLYRLPYMNGLNISEGRPGSGAFQKTDAGQSKSALMPEKRIDWLIVDHYLLDRQWELEVRPYSDNIMVIDDLANRPHECDLLLDQNLHEDMEIRYEGLVPPHCGKYLGTKYALLRAEFKKARRNVRKRDGAIRRILVSFGGSDPTNETGKALKAIQLLNSPNVVTDVVIGASNPFREEIKTFCENFPNFMVHCQVPNIEDLMAMADLSIGAGGIMTWERCCMGLPSLVIAVAPNQIKIAEAIGKYKLGIYMGVSEQVAPALIHAELAGLINNKEAVLKFGMNAFNLVDGSGAERLAEALLNEIKTGINA